MFFTILYYVLPVVLVLWFGMKMLSGFLGLYVMSYGSESLQDQVSKNTSLSSRMGLMLAVIRSNATPKDPNAPRSESLRAAMDQLEALKIERETLEVRREIDGLRSPVPVSSAVPVAAAAAAATAIAVSTTLPADELDDEAVVAQASEFDQVTMPGEPEEDVMEPPADSSPVIRDPESGDLIPV